MACMVRSGRLSAVLVAAMALVVAPDGARATDAGVVGKRLVLTRSASGRESLRSTQKDAAVSFGGGSAASELSGTFEIFYVDAPANRATLDLPSPWERNTGVVATFRNRLAPNGPTAVSSARVTGTRTAVVVAKGLGGIDITSSPGSGGVVSMLTIANAGDGTMHRMCSLYSTASGSKVTHRVGSNGSAKLVLSNGVPTACPTCSDGVKNDRETDIDCGGPACQICQVGQGCAAGSDCESGLCTSGICQATCNDGIQDGAETDVDCGGPSCPECGPGQHCGAPADCDSLVCTAGLCQAATCGDGVRNQDETDLDCGGASCPACVPFTVTIDSPAHGSFSTAGTAAITGHTTGVGPAGALLTINGNPVALDPGGTFSTTIPLVPSAVFNPAYARLVRNFDGLTAYDRVVVIAGQSIADGAVSPNGVAMRLNDRGLDAVEPVATTLVDIDPATFVTPGVPVITDYCYAWLGSLCLGSVDATISNTPPPTVGPLGIAIDSQTGFVAGDISIHDLRVAIDIDNASGLPIHCELQLTVPLTNILGDFDFSPLAPQPTKVDVTQVGGVEVIATGTTYQSDCSGILGPIAEALIGQAIGDVGVLFADGMEGFLNQVDGNGNTALAAALETSLGGIDIAGPVGSGLGVDLYAPFTSIVEDEAGITFATDIRATTLVPHPLAPDLAASLHVPEAFPTFGLTTPVQGLPFGIGFGISTSGFNQLLKSQTESGLMRSSLTEIDLFGSPLPITAGLLAAAFPGFASIPPATPIAIRIAPTLAPVVSGATGPSGELGEIRIGHIVIEFVQDEGLPTEVSHLALAADVRLGLDLAFLPDGIGFVLSEPSGPDLTIAVLENPLAISDGSLAAFLPQMLASSLPVLASALQSFPLPEFIGLGLSGVEVSRNGQYYSIFADLTPNCTDGSQCPSGVCLSPVCQSPTCSDGVENGAETTVDCGGGSCPGCATGETCFLSTDCASGGCSGGICQPGCTTGAECPSGVCTGGYCRAANCADGAQNGEETDVDCGGTAPSCVRCADGEGCASGADCGSQVCSGGICQPPSCSDGIRNGAEVGVDCGGGSCPGCTLGSPCSAAADCQSGVCGLNATCTCGNHLFTFTVNSNSGGLFDSAEWPGGTASQTGPTGCGVTINRPNDNIDLACTLASPFSVQSFSGYSNCFGSGGEDGDGCQPVSCPLAGIGSCCSGRPSCSAALNGSGSAKYFVQCLE
jgi:hypothetical protein